MISDLAGAAMLATAIALSPEAERYLPRQGEVNSALLPAQEELLSDTATRQLYIVGGIGSGKTRGLVLKALQLGTLNPGLPGLFVEPTFNLIDVAIREFLSVFEEWGMEEGFDFVLHRSIPQRLEVFLCDVEFEVLFRSSAKARSLVAYNVAWAVVDEAADHTEAAADQCNMRCRHSLAKNIQVVFGGTPEALGGWFYDRAKGNPAPSSRLIRAKTSDNHLLPGGAAEWIRLNLGHLTEQNRKRYVDGEFIAPGGRVYTCYKPKLHERPCTNPGEGQQVMCCDFGQGCMAWVFGRVTGDRVVHYHGEQILEGVGIHEARDRAVAWWQAFFLRETGRELSKAETTRRVLVYADPAGSFGTENWGGTYVGELEKVGFDVLHRPAHPAIFDRINSVEAKFYSNEAFVDPDACPLLCRSLQTQIFDPRTSKPKKNRGREGIRGLDHTNDAIGYHIEFEWRAAMLRGNVIEY